ncbi:hypothetical protein OG21DRAFT_1507742 [Imleria badia]|nr:hypothetical protein OG21DRAFT_1507742 [Imleria badia]
MATPSSNNPLLPLPTSASASSQSSSATPATPTTTPTTQTTTTSNAATSTSATSSASSTTSSSATTSTQSSSSSTAGLTPVATPFVTTSGDQVITSTSFVVASTTPTPANNSTTSNSFFANKGAVAGVFTVVGLIVVALIVAFVVNAIRRRRAENFDRDVAEAAAEAAASSRSPFDDYSYNNSGSNGGGGGGGGGAYGYSDNSHGTFQLPPLSPHNEVYGMTEMSQFDPYAAGAASLAASAVGRSRSRKESEPGAPGIAGVGAGTLAREPSKRAPYHAFAGPQPHELQGSNGTFRSRRSNQDVLEAAGLGGAGVAAIPSNNNLNNGASGAFVTRKPSETAQSTQFGRSQFGSMSSGGHPTPLQPGYPVESYYPQRNESHSPDPFAGYPPVATVSKSLPNPHAAAPLPSLTGHQSDHNEDFTESGSPTALRSDEQRMSYQDDTDYSQGHRVLRVANE